MRHPEPPAEPSGAFLFSASRRPASHPVTRLLSLLLLLWYIPFVRPKIESLIIKVSGDRMEGAVDEVASELPVRLLLNDTPLVTLLCTPTELKELAVGFLLSEGILANRADLRQVDVSDTDP